MPDQWKLRFGSAGPDEIIDLAPNALTSFLSGPWFATTEINDTSEFVWGMNVGFALTTDVFAALAD